MKTLASVRTHLIALFRSPRGKTIEHLAVVFAATFAVDAGGNYRHILDASGLNGLKAAGYAAAATAAAAAYHAVRPQLAALISKAIADAATK